MDSVPFVIVVGDEEAASRKLTVTIRRKSQPNKPFKEQLTTEELDRNGTKGYCGKTVQAPVYPEEAFEKGPVYLIFLPSFF